MAVQTTGRGPAPGWRAGPQGNGDLPSPIPFSAHINAFLLQTRLFSFPLHEEFINCPPALLAALGWDTWEEVLSCKTEVLKLKFVKNKVFAHLLLLSGSVCEYKGGCESCHTQLPLPELHLEVSLQSLLQWALPPATRKEESGGGPCPCPWFK